MDKEAFRAKRESLGLTQTEIARELGCGLRTVQEWESGETQIRLITERALRDLEREKVQQRLEAREAGHKTPPTQRPT